MRSQAFAAHAQAYGGAISRALKQAPGYDESQCVSCAYGHRCCDLIVSCTPYEAIGIAHWIAVNFSEGRANRIYRAIRRRARQLKAHLGKYGKDDDAAYDDWAAARIKCVFYDKNKHRCAIYPVRPARCREAFGAGDCSDLSGINAMQVNGDVETERALRVRLANDPDHLYGEMTGMVARMLDGPQVMLSESARALYASDSDALNDEHYLFGLDMENNDGRSQRS